MRDERRETRDPLAGRLRRWRAACGLLVLLFAPSLSAQTTLPIGSASSGIATSEAAASFRFVPPGAGILTVVVSGSDDLIIEVVDEDGQQFPGGRADGDNQGSTGLEFIAMPVGNSEPVIVRVEMLSESGGGGAFRIAAAFVAEDGFSRPIDPDRRPSLAGAIKVGSASDESLDPAGGDRWDWFSVTASEAMTVAVVTRMTDGAEGDLVIEAYTGGDFAEAVARSDQDLQGHTGNESVTLDLAAGQTAHFKVAALWDSGGHAPYRLSVGRVP